MNEHPQPDSRDSLANLIHSKPRDVFIYLLVIIMLYTSVCELITILFDYVNISFPDPLDSSANQLESIRMAVAVLVVAFPVYLWASRFIARDLAAHPEKSELSIRRWLLFLTLFLAALIIIGDLVALVYNFMGGDLTARFILKVSAILVVAGAVFGYYRYELRRAPAEFSNEARWLVRISAAAVVVAVVAGFVLAGSPARQRLVRTDLRRISDLSTLQNEIVDYYRAKNALPQSLDQLTNSISGFHPPNDPQSLRPYEYRVTGTLSFQLCADFSLPSAEENAKGYSSYSTPGVSDWNWSHGTGRSCFTRTIDPAFYGGPPVPRIAPLPTIPPIR
jgi:Domain of unknown function (DUF5671)